MKNKSKTPFRPYYVIESSGEDIASHGSYETQVEAETCCDELIDMWGHKAEFYVEYNDDGEAPYYLTC